MSELKEIMSTQSKAVFLDRDGVINFPVFNSDTGNYEAPFKLEDLKLFPHALEAMKLLNNKGYKLFIVTNQPDFAKGKTTLENLIKIKEKMLSIFKENGVEVLEYYACFHHPKGIVPEYTMKCECRKTGNLFLKDAIQKYNLDLQALWMVGDRDTDIQCGQSLGAKTILIYSEHSVDEGNAGKSNPTFKAKDIKEAANIILQN